MRAYGISEERARREKIAALFLSEYGQEPQNWFSSPGGVELMGSHTEHNLGKGIFSAISCDILCAANPRSDDRVEIRAEELDPICFSVYDLENREREKGRSVSLARGVLRFLRRRGYNFRGFSVFFHNQIFRGAVSSSAAFAMLIAQVVNEFYLGGSLSPLECAMAGNYAESICFGKTGSLSDHAAIVFGGCNYFDYGAKEPVTRLSAPEGYRVILTNAANVSELPQAAEIKREMCAVAAYFGKKVLKEVSFAELQDGLADLRRHVGDRAALCALYFFEENARADLAAQALARKDTGLFLSQMRRSGEGGMSLLQSCSFGCHGLALALKLGEHLIKDGACRMMSGTVLAVIKDGEEHNYVKAMIRMFGRENVLSTTFLSAGCSKIEF